MATNAERRAAKIEFATRANQFTQTARALLEEWERCEMQTAARATGSAAIADERTAGHRLVLKSAGRGTAIVSRM